jgi:hypothetical protein
VHDQFFVAPAERIPACTTIDATARPTATSSARTAPEFETDGGVFRTEMPSFRRPPHPLVGTARFSRQTSF